MSVQFSASNSIIPNIKTPYLSTLERLSNFSSQTPINIHRNARIPPRRRWHPLGLLTQAFPPFRFHPQVPCIAKETNESSASEDEKSEVCNWRTEIWSLILENWLLLVGARNLNLKIWRIVREPYANAVLLELSEKRKRNLSRIMRHGN